MLGILLSFSTAQCGRARFDLVADSSEAVGGDAGESSAAAGQNGGFNGSPAGSGGISGGMSGAAGISGAAGVSGTGGTSGSAGMPAIGGRGPACLSVACAGECAFCENEHDCPPGDACLCNRCVECDDDQDCGDFACEVSTGRCIRPCASNQECRHECRPVGSVPLGCVDCVNDGVADDACGDNAEGNICFYGDCVECVSSADCPADRKRCIQGECTCVDDGDCEGRLRCHRGVCS